MITKKERICRELDGRMNLITGFIRYLKSKRKTLPRPFGLLLRRLIDELRMKKATLEIKKDLLECSTGKCPDLEKRTNEAMKDAATSINHARKIIIELAA